MATLAVGQRLRSGQVAAAAGVNLQTLEIAELLDAAHHRHGRGTDTRLRERAQAKLVDVEARIADLTAIADTLRAAESAGCHDLEVCAGTPGCPLPFAQPDGVAQMSRS